VALSATTAASAAANASADAVPKPLRVYVVGDSIATYFATGLYDWGQKHPGTVVVYTDNHSGCPVTRGGSIRFLSSDAPNDLSDCDAMIAQWPADLQSFQPDVVIVATGPTNTADRELPGDDAWSSLGDPAVDQYQLAQMQEDIDTLHQTGARVLWLDLPYEQRDKGEITGSPLLDSSDPVRIDRYNQLLDQLAKTRPVSILRWSKYFDALSVEDDLALRVSDGLHLKSESTQMVLDKFLWADIRDGYLAGKASSG
jgi:hypothetical protein